MKFTRQRVNEPTINEHDQTKAMLQFMNGGTKQATVDAVLNEHDQTKLMLKVLNEDMTTQPTEAAPTPPVSSEQEDVITLSGNELVAEEDLFGEHVSQDFKTDVDDNGAPLFKIYPSDNNVVWSGVMGKGIKWRLSKNDDVVIRAENLELEDRDMEMIENLKKYSANWSDEWAKKLRTDYKPKRNEF
tara:strand:+ start:34157 stop:34717 length:561 start_codon:yes stop_codon:yes gene_type:complete